MSPDQFTRNQWRCAAGRQAVMATRLDRVLSPVLAVLIGAAGAAWLVLWWST